MGEAVRSDIELNILRLLLSRASAVVQPNTAKSDLKALLDQLSDYVWSDQEHRVVYECLRSTRWVHMARLRQEMASGATRLGHPDVDWDCYFKQPDENPDVADLILRVKGNRL
ncbi:MAG TPA: hypothetical protein VJS43_08740 [Candidatus Acidoferrales bacterium]|nr:hypothetical protein [Candidatus Acidoferrales bacterium]